MFPKRNRPWPSSAHSATPPTSLSASCRCRATPASRQASAGMNPELQLPLERRIGKRSASVIEKHLGLDRVGELLNYFPRRYLSRGELTPISKLPLDEEATLIARVLSNST